MPLTTTIRNLLIFSDLDGTLLDRDTGCFEEAELALRLIRKRGIALILCSSKTRSEIEHYRRRLDNHHPFISENGGAIFIPKGYFSFPFPYDREWDPYMVLELGVFYPTLLEVLESVQRETGVKLSGFSQLSPEALSSLTGLGLEKVRFAKQREYDEPFLIEGGEEEIERVKRKIEASGMRYSWGGRFHHIHGKHDKGKAVQILTELYGKEYSSISTIGIGDSMNDLPMLLAVDHPIFLRAKGDPSWLSASEIPNISMIEGTGPRAWKEAISRVLSDLC